MSTIYENGLPPLGAVKKAKSTSLRSSLVFLLIATVVTGILYPLAITGLAQLLSPVQANGSLLRDKNGVVRGSSLLAQDFSSPRFFHARPSAAAYSAGGGTASNLGSGSAKLQAQVKQLGTAWQAENGANLVPPSEMLYASGSGLDPDISLNAALQQIDRVAAVRKLSAENKAALETLVRASLAADGVSRVNVTVLNWKMENDDRFRDGK